MRPLGCEALVDRRMLGEKHKTPNKHKAFSPKTLRLFCMENLKVYLPYIIVGAIALYAIKKFGAQQTGPSLRSVIPLTPAGTSYTDPNAPFRAGAFERLAGVAQSQIEGETAKGSQQIQAGQNLQAQQVAFATLDAQKALGLAGFGIQKELGLAGLQAQETLGKLREETLKFLQGEEFRLGQLSLQGRERELELVGREREADRQFQAAAIDRAARADEFRLKTEERRNSAARRTALLQQLIGTGTKILGQLFKF